MTTLADMRKSAEKTATFTDSTTPEGHFVAVYKDSLIGFVTYLLRGAEGDETAQVVGRVQNGIAYAGDRLLGGTYLGRHEYTKDAFAAIVAHAAKEV